MNGLAYLSSPRFQGFKPGFARTQALLKALGNPERRLKFIHVAGTNGKGSVSACLSAILTSAGYRTGLYTSPYVVRWNERVQVNGTDIADDALEAAVDALRPIADAMEDAPSQFELETALALWHFARTGCQLAVLEVGMGGAWDATNVIPAPEAAVLTAIGLDHCAVLGNTLGEIAAVKSGIIKPGCDVVSYGESPEAEAVIAEACRKAGCRLFHPDFSAIRPHSLDLSGCRFDYGSHPDLFLPLAGAYQPKNAALAVTVAEVLRTRGWSIPETAIRKGLAAVRWPGRFELLRRSPVFILDGSHNPQGMAATAESLRAHFGSRKLIFLMGVMADKDVHGIARLLGPLAAGFVAVEPPNPRAMKPAELAELLTADTGIPAVPYDSIEAGVAEAVRQAGPGGIVAAIGSLYFSGQVRAAVAALPAAQQS